MQAFVKEVGEFNAACPKSPNFDPLHLDGVCTSDLAINNSNWALAIESPPYVAYAVTAGITFTYGGLKADLSGRFMNNEDRVMPGLYACGEMRV